MLARFWRLAASDFTLKVLSFLLAIFIWSYVVSQRNTIVEIPVRIAVIPPSNTIMESPEVFTFTVRLKGAVELIDRLPRPIEVIHRCEPLRAPREERSLDIRASLLGLPAGVSLLSRINPIKIVLAERATVTVPVIPQTSGSPPSGYYHEIERYEPAKLSVTGPRSALNAITQLLTEPIDLSGRTVSFETVVRVEPPADNPEVKIENRYIKVLVRILPVTGKRELAVEVFAVASPGSRFSVRSINPPKVKLVVKGPQALLDKLSPDDIMVYVDLDRFDTPGIHTDVLTRVVLPNGLELEGSPPRVEIFLEQKNE